MQFQTTITLIALMLGLEKISSTKIGDKSVENTTKPSKAGSNPLATLILNRNEIGDVTHSSGLPAENLSRVKRQYGYYNYDPYYYRRYRRPYPLPILVGGGFGPRFGGRGFGFGGRGFGGRGFGGFGGRGFGGFGGRGFGGFGGGRGGGRG